MAFVYHNNILYAWIEERTPFAESHSSDGTLASTETGGVDACRAAFCLVPFRRRLLLDAASAEAEPGRSRRVALGRPG